MMMMMMMIGVTPVRAFVLDPPEKFELFFYDALARHEEVSDV